MIRIVMTFAMALALVGVAGAVAGPTSGEAPRKIINPDYVGHLLYGPDTRIAIAITGSRGRREIRFQAKGVELACDDDRRPRLGIGPVSTRLRGNGRFAFLDYYVDNLSSNQTLLAFEGRLRDRGSARGYVVYLEDPWDAPGELNEPECSTLGKARWKAQRVR